MRGTTRTKPAETGERKVDARSERWKEHREKVRGEIVDAAFRSIDRLGPEVSVREVAAEAGTAKPKIYRHFADKDDLFEAVGTRLRDDLWSAIFASIDVATDSLRELVRRSVEEYVALVDDHPNVLRFFIQGQKRTQSDSRLRTLNQGRTITLAMAEMLGEELRDFDLNRGALELAAFAAFGSATSATDWWLGPELDSPRRLPREMFVSYLTTIMISVVNGTAENLGLVMDPDRPIRSAASSQQSA